MSNINNCSICRPTDQETKLIEHSLLSQIRKQKQISSILDESFQETIDDNEGFYRVLKVIFSKKFNNFKGTKLCKHQPLKKQFAVKLNCSVKMLDFISNVLLTRIAKHNFHIDVVCNQIKTFGRHFLNEDAHTPPKFEKAGQKGSTEKRRQKMGENMDQTVKQAKNGSSQIREEQDVAFSNGLPINTYFPQFIQLPQNYSAIFPSMNFSWGLTFPEKEFPQNDKPDQQ